MIRPYKIPIWLLMTCPVLLCIGELVTRTPVLYVTMMAGTMLCVGITYNFLGGISTLSGMFFAEFALRTIVVSQIGKVILFEPADKNLEAPLLTMGAYFVFYFSLMLGVFVYGRLRMHWLKPLEPETNAQSNITYTFSLLAGLIANLAYQTTTVLGGSYVEDQRYGATRSLGLIFSALLLFSLVVAVDQKIRQTDGRRSFGIAAFVSWASAMFFGFLSTSRAGIILPTIVYLISCYVRGYKFRKKHILITALGSLIFVFYISPFELYSREILTGMSFEDRIYNAIDLLRNVPERAVLVQATQRAEQSGEAREAYFDTPGTFVLSRLAIIRADSNMVAACAGGYHYGWTSIKIDLLSMVPRFLYKNKINSGSTSFTGRVTGMNSDDVENGFSVLSPIADAYGGFGWLGVILAGVLLFPVMFVVMESMFDISKPWGTVVLGTLMATAGEGNVGTYIGELIRTPVYIISLSFLLGGLIRLMPVKGDLGVSVPRIQSQKQFSEM